MANGKGIAYLGLVLGSIGAGLGSYVFFDYTIAPLFGLSEPTPDIDSYFDKIYNTQLDATGTYLPLLGLNVTFTTTEIVAFYVLYICYVRISSASGESVSIRIALNDVSITELLYYVEEFNAAGQERFVVSMQEYIPALAPGYYNLTVYANIDHTTAISYMNSLYILTFT